MKAVQLTRYGDPSKVLVIRETPLPKPGTGEVRVRIRATPVNPSDLLVRAGMWIAGARQA